MTEKFNSLVLVACEPQPGSCCIVMQSPTSADGSMPGNVYSKSRSLVSLAPIDILKCYVYTNNEWTRDAGLYGTGCILPDNIKIFGVPGYSVEVAAALCEWLYDPYNKYVSVPPWTVALKLSLKEGRAIFDPSSTRYLGDILLAPAESRFPLPGDRGRLVDKIRDWADDKMGTWVHNTPPQAPTTCGLCEHYIFMEMSCRKNRELKNLEPLHSCKLEEVTK